MSRRRRRDRAATGLEIPSDPPRLDPGAPSAMGPELEAADPEPIEDPIEHDPVETDALAPEVVAPPGDRRRGPRFSLLTGTLLLSVIALLGGYLIMNLVLMPSLTRQGAEVRVPEIVGLSEREAERVLAREDLKLSKISEQWSAEVPRGFVSEQEPPAGGLVKRGRRISVIVSLGAQGTTVPLLDGVSARQSEILLEGAGLKQGRVARAYSDAVAKDMIIATDPPGDTMVEQETSVDVLVSLGPVPRSFVLPDFKGRDASLTARGLRDEGFYVALRQGGPRQGSGVIGAQDPPPGRRIAPRDSILLYYYP